MSASEPEIVETQPVPISRQLAPVPAPFLDEPVRNTPPRYRDYSADYKAEILALIEAGATPFDIGVQTGIPRQTIHNWMRQSARYAHLVTRKAGDLPQKLEDLAHSAADFLGDGRLADASTRELLGALHISVPLLQLLRGEPTVIVGLSDADRQLRLAEILSRLEARGASADHNILSPTTDETVITPSSGKKP